MNEADSEQSLVNIPMGTHWQNNSCAYNAVLIILFNVWWEDPDAIQVDWQELQSVQLNELLSTFQSHESLPGDHDTHWTRSGSM